MRLHLIPPAEKREIKAAYADAHAAIVALERQAVAQQMMEVKRLEADWAATVEYSAKPKHLTLGQDQYLTH
jgi:hypothetical protein